MNTLLLNPAAESKPQAVLANKGWPWESEVPEDGFYETSYLVYKTLVFKQLADQNSNFNPQGFKFVV